MEQLMKAQPILISSQALLVQLEFPQSFVLLVASWAGVLHQVEAGLGGVVAQRAVVDTWLRAIRTVQLLQMLWNRQVESLKVRCIHLLGTVQKFQSRSNFIVFFSRYLCNILNLARKSFLLLSFQLNSKNSNTQKSHLPGSKKATKKVNSQHFSQTHYWLQWYYRYFWKKNTREQDSWLMALLYKSTAQVKIFKKYIFKKGIGIKARYKRDRQTWNYQTEIDITSKQLSLV